MPTLLNLSAIAKSFELTCIHGYRPVLKAGIGGGGSQIRLSDCFSFHPTSVISNTRTDTKENFIFTCFLVLFTIYTLHKIIGTENSN